MRESRLSQYKQNKLIEIFLASVTALAAAKLVNINKLQLITFIVYHCLSLKALHMEMFESEIQANESYFGGALKGKLSQGEAGKTS